MGLHFVALEFSGQLPFRHNRLWHVNRILNDQIDRRLLFDHRKLIFLVIIQPQSVPRDRHGRLVVPVQRPMARLRHQQACTVGVTLVGFENGVDSQAGSSELLTLLVAFVEHRQQLFDLHFIL